MNVHRRGFFYFLKKNGKKFLDIQFSIFMYTCTFFVMIVSCSIYIYIYIFRKRIDIRYQGGSSILLAAFECVKMNRNRGIQPKRVWIIYGWRTENRETKQTFEPKITIMNHLSKWILHSFEIYWNSSGEGGDRFYSLWRNNSTFSSIELAKNR